LSSVDKSAVREPRKYSAPLAAGILFVFRKSQLAPSMAWAQPLPQKVARKSSTEPRLPKSHECDSPILGVGTQLT